MAEPHKPRHQRNSWCPIVGRSHMLRIAAGCRSTVFFRPRSTINYREIPVAIVEACSFQDGMISDTGGTETTVPVTEICHDISYSSLVGFGRKKKALGNCVCVCSPSRENVDIFLNEQREF